MGIRSPSRKNIITLGIMGIIIVTLSLYLAFRNREKIQYRMPSLANVHIADIETVIIHRKSDTVELIKSDDEWIIHPEGYPADRSTLNEMLNAIAGLSLIDLVSVTENYSRYGLDEDSRIEVIAANRDKILRNFYVGNRASPFNYTYIILQDDTRVFHAEGYLQVVFEQAREEYIDRLVLSFEREEITEILLAGEAKSLRLIKSAGSSDQESDESQVFWKAASGNVWNAVKVDIILSNLSDLFCSGYGQDEPDQADSLLSITLRGDKEYRLELFNKQGNQYPATSSESAHPFFLSSWVADSIMDFLEGE